MRCCRCEPVVYGPGNDNYGMDNMLEDWECPQCHKIFRFSCLSIRTGIDKCENCGWLSDQGKMFENIITKFKCKINDGNLECKNDV